MLYFKIVFKQSKWLFRSRGLRYEKFSGTSLTLSYFVNKLQSKLSAKKLLTKSGLMPSLIVVSFRPFTIYTKTNHAPVLFIAALELSGFLYNVTLKCCLPKQYIYLKITLKSKLCHHDKIQMLIHILKVFDVKRGLCLA